MAWAVTVLARGEVFTACSEGGALANESRVGGERRKDFLRMPRKESLDRCVLDRQGDMNIPFGRRVGEDICMVGETWVMFGVGEKEAADKQSPPKPVLYAET